MKIENGIEYISLFEYTGKGNGKEVGGKVFAAAKHSGVKVLSQEIESKTWNGKVILYPKHWLGENFDKIKNELSVVKQTNDDDLPF